jgi:hypothetical protein
VGGINNSNTAKCSSYYRHYRSRLAMIGEENRRKWYTNKMLDLMEASAGTNLDLTL